ncbi:Alpha/Beta hydrolase protein [Trichoderma austrokoningii]
MAELITTTHTYKSINGLDLTINISRATTQDNNVVLLHYHAGFLLLGEKTTFPPYWLINACKKRGWTYATASHRAGAYLAFTATASPLCPKPLALLSIYGMIDFLNSRYVHSGQRLRDGVPNEDEILKEVDAAIQGAKAVDGHPFPSNLAADQRFKWASTLHQTARYIDVLTRSPGLTEKIAKQGIQAIPKEHRPLFPATFGLNTDFPPTVLLHGDVDDLVDFGLSSSVAVKFQNAGIDVHLERARESLKRVVAILERCTKES